MKIPRNIQTAFSGLAGLAGLTGLAGFTLVEVTLALGVASFCLLTVFGLVPIGLTSNQNASEQTAAAGIATAISSDLHGTPVVSGSSSRFHISVPAAGGTGTHTVFFSQDGTPTGDVDVNAVGALPTPSRYRATVTCLAQDTSAQAPASPRNKQFKVWIRITWPAMADAAASKAPANFAGSFETVTSLNCN